MAASWTDTFFCDEYLLKRGESHGSFLSKLHHLKHFFDALDLYRFFWPIATFYLLYVASGFLWILAFPDDPFSLKQIQEFSASMTSYSDGFHKFLLPFMALAFARVYTIFCLTIPRIKQLFNTFLVNLKNDDDTEEKDQENAVLARKFSRYLLLHGIIIFWNGSPNLQHRFPGRDYRFLIERGVLTQKEFDVLSMSETRRQSQIPISWLMCLIKEALENGNLSKNERTRCLTLDLQSLMANLEGSTRTLPLDGGNIPHILLLCAKVAVCVFGLSALLGRFYVGRGVVITEFPLLIQTLIVLLPTPKMVTFAFLWVLLKLSLIATNPFDNIDMADFIYKSEHNRYRALNAYYPENAFGRHLVHQTEHEHPIFTHL